MAYINLNVTYPVYDGMPITFEAPCDCTATEGVTVGSQNYSFADAHGAILTGIGNLFMKGALVKVILDTEKKLAYVQNADTNSYLEGKATKATLVTNTDVATAKTVPATSAPYAKVLEIGGMTYKEGETLRSAAVTEVESVGVNLLDSFDINNNTVVGVTAKSVSNGHIKLSGTKYGGNVIPIKTYDNLVLPTGEYTLAAKVISGTYTHPTDTMHRFFLNDEKIMCEIGGTPKVIKLTEPLVITKMGLVIYRDDGVFNDEIIAVMLNRGPTPLPYTPYTRHTLPIPIAVQALDGYGWGVSDTVYNYIDWEKKQFVKRVGCVDMGTLTWIQNVTSQFYAELPNRGAQYSMNSLCSKYEASATGAYYNAVDKSVSLEGNNAWLKDTSYTDATAFKAAMAGVMLYYELAEPVVTDISDLLPADSYIGVEGGGRVTMVSEYGYDVPSKVVFFEGSSRAIGAETFVGDLAGVAARAEADGEGNRISDTYVTRAELEERLTALAASLISAQTTQE